MKILKGLFHRDHKPERIPARPTGSSGREFIRSGREITDDRKEGYYGYG